jgi:tetratricopeptide (TPR) repeat protein
VGAPRLGEKIGRYVLLRPIAAGGMGSVWAAWDPELDRNVAVKLLLPRRGGHEERDALIGEARALARLSHANVVQVYDVGTWGDEVWIALEYLGGTSLDRWVSAKRRGWPEVLDALMHAGRGLAAAHAAGVVHLDVKPGNVVVGDDGGVRVLDFGLARCVVSDSSSTDVRVGDTAERPYKPAVGTIGYIAPELLLGGEADTRCDQFGFCVMAWEALVGARPFPGRARVQYEHAVLERAIVEPPQGTRVPARVLRVLRRGLARGRDQRFADMDELLAALEHARVSWPARLVLPVGIGVAIVGVAIALLPDTPVLPPCDGGAREFAAAWSPARRAEVERAFSATGERYAGAAAVSVAATMRAWGERWAEAADATCAAAATRGDAGGDIERRKAACLREQLLAVDALGDVFVSADRGVVEGAAAAARALPDPTLCSDLDHIARVDPLVDDVDATRRLAEARALLHSHQLVSAADIAREVASQAEQEGAWRVAANAHAVASRALGTRGEIEGAIAASHRAIWAAELAGDDELRAITFADLVFTSGHLGRDVARAHWYARAAAEIMTRIGATSAPRSVLAGNLGAVLTDEGRYAESVARYQEAVEMRIAAGLGIDDVLATLMNNLGAAHLARSDYGGAAAWFTQSLALRVVLVGPDHPDVADVLANQGSVLQVLGEDDAALAHFVRSADVLESTRGRDDPSLNVVHNGLAIVLAKVGREDEALAHYRESLRLWRMLDPRHPMTGAVLHNMAEIDVSRGRHGAALALEREALAMLQGAFPEGHPYSVAVLSGIGRTELARGQPARAIAPLRAALDMALHVEADAAIEAETQLALAQALDRLGREPALVAAYARRARATFVEFGPRTKKQLAELDAWALARAQP